MIGVRCFFGSCEAAVFGRLHNNPGTARFAFFYPLKNT